MLLSKQTKMFKPFTTTTLQWYRNAFNYTNFKLDKKQIEYILKGGAGNNNESLGSNSDKITKKNMAIKMLQGVTER